MVFGKYPPAKYDRLATAEKAGAISAADFSKLAGYPTTPALMTFIGESATEADLTEAAAASGWRAVPGAALTTPMEVTITSTGPTDRFLLIGSLRSYYATVAPGTLFLGYSVGTVLVEQILAGNNLSVVGTDQGLNGLRSFSGLAAGSYVVQLRFYTSAAVAARFFTRYLQVFQTR